jgi:methionyl-tRNA formyltransferase
MSTPVYSVLFYGTPSIAEICLRSLLSHPSLSIRAVVTQPDRPVGRKQIITQSPTKRCALEHGIPVVQPERIRSHEAEFLREIAVLGPYDLAVVVAFGQILPKTVLSLPRMGSLNVHASLLPRWRGAAPIQRAIMAGDCESGVCLMEMEEGLDTGGVYSKARVPIPESMNAQELHDALADAGAQLLRTDLVSIIEGSRKPEPQGNEGITYAKKIVDSDAVIDWKDASTKIHCQIRGLSPTPCAYTRIDHKRLKIIRSRCAPDQRAPTTDQPPGFVEFGSDTLFIMAGDGRLEIDLLQLEGKGVMTSQDFMRGYGFFNKRVLGG